MCHKLLDLYEEHFTIAKRPLSTTFDWIKSNHNHAYFPYNTIFKQLINLVDLTIDNPDINKVI